MSDFFKRLGNVIKGAASEFISELESDNPREVAEAAALGAEGRYKEAMSRLASLRVQRDKLTAEKDKLSREIDDLTRQQLAIEASDPALALELGTAIEPMNTRLGDLESQLSAVESASAELMTALPQIKAGVGAVRNEADLLVARKLSAEHEINAADLAAGTATDPVGRALQNVRTHVDKLHSQASEVDVIPAVVASPSAPLPSAEQISKLKAQARLAQLKAERKTSSAEVVPAEIGGTAPAEAPATPVEPAASPAPSSEDDPLPGRRL